MTVCDAHTLEIVGELSVRDFDWGSIRYGGDAPMQEQLPVLVNDAKAMLASVVPGLMHGAGI
ncbi:MAG: hypothetical protein WDM81_16235 [Rhizomicrobium sp.]